MRAGCAEGSPRDGGFVRGVRAATLRLLAVGALVLAAIGAAGATDPFVVIVNPSVPGTSVRRADLVAVFMKKAVRWGDGSLASPVDQSGTSAVRKAFSETVLQMPVVSVMQYWQRQLLSLAASIKVPVVKGSDDEVLAYVAKTSGSVGYVSAGVALPPGVKAVSIID